MKQAIEEIKVADGVPLTYSNLFGINNLNQKAIETPEGEPRPRLLRRRFAAVESYLADRPG